MNYFEIFALTISTYFLVFLRGIQQQNVIHGNYILAASTPFVIAISEVASLLFVVKIGWHSVPFVGLGGSLGIITSMYAHRKWVRGFK